MKYAFVLTESQRMALCTLIIDYQMGPNHGCKFTDCSVDPAVTTTPEDLLAIFVLPTSVVESDAPRLTP
jgi:hypothetical protein